MNAKVDRLFEQYRGTDAVYPLVHTIFPVALGSKPAAQIYAENLEMLKDWKGTLDSLGLKATERSTNVGRIMPKYIPYNITKKDNTEFEIEMSRLSFETGNDSIKYGILLGYPKCCVENHYEDTESDVFPDIRVQEQLKFWKEKGREIDPLAFYTAEFIPCRPDCQEAASRGRKILDSYGNPEIREVYVKLAEKRIVELENGDIEPCVNSMMLAGVPTMSSKFEVVQVVFVGLHKPKKK